MAPECGHPARAVYGWLIVGDFDDPWFALCKACWVVLAFNNRRAYRDEGAC